MFSIPLALFNLPLIGLFTWLTPPGPYRAMTCRERELAVEHIGLHNFLSTQGHGEPSQMTNQVNAGASSETLKTIHIIHSHIHSDKADMRRIIFGGLVGLNLPDVCLTGGEKPRKISPRKLVPTGDRTRARWVIGVHAAACSTAVDLLYMHEV